MSKTETPPSNQGGEPLAEGTRVRLADANLEAVIVGHVKKGRAFVEYKVKGELPNGRAFECFASPDSVVDLTPPAPEQPPAPKLPLDPPAPPAEALAAWEKDADLRAKWKDDKAAYLADAVKTAANTAGGTDGRG